MSKPLTTYTPGPWTLKPGTNKTLILEDASGYLSVSLPAHNATDFANAHLLKACTDMYGVLSEVLKVARVHINDKVLLLHIERSLDRANGVLP